MKTTIFIIASLFASAALASAEGIPVDRKTGKIWCEHAVVSLTPEQIEETQTLGTFTLTAGQWKDLRAKRPGCPKRFDIVLPVTYDDCCCGVDAEYVIALSRDRIAVLMGGGADSVSAESVRASLVKVPRNAPLRMNERGEFYLGRSLVPYPTLLKALSAPPKGSRKGNDGKLLLTHTEEGREYSTTPWLVVDLPVGAKPTDAVYESRLREIAALADKMGLGHRLFPDRGK